MKHELSRLPDGPGVRVKRALLFGAALAAVATVAVLALLMPGGEDGPATAEVAETPAPVAETPVSPAGTPVPRWPEPPPDGIQYLGPYRFIAPGYQGPLPHRDFDRGSAAASEVAHGLEDARESSLFPDGIPEGYEVVDAHSAGQPSELYLELTLRDQAGRLLLLRRSRPTVMPVDVRMDELPGASRVFLGASAEGVFIAPPVGLQASQPSVLRGYERGIDTEVSSVGLRQDEAEEIFKTVSRSFRGGSMAERLAQELPPESDLMPQPGTVDRSGPCTVTPHLTIEYAAQATQLSLMARATCVDLMPAQLCSAEEREWLGEEADEIDLACDSAGEPIEAEWRSFGGISSCRHGVRAVLGEGGIVSGFTDCLVIITWVPEHVPIEVCLTIRGQESCARFHYTLE